MIFLVFSIFCSVSIAHLFKYVEKKDLPTFGLFAVNYIVAFLVAILGSQGALFIRRPSPPIALLGAIVGVLFVCSYILLTLSIKMLGVTIPVSLMRLSAVLPTFGSIVFFSEIPHAWQLAGIILAFLSLPLASEERIVFTNLTQVIHDGFGRGLMLFMVFGIANFIFKIQQEVYSSNTPYFFLSIVYFTSFLVSVSVAIYQKARITSTVIGFGIILGVLNLFSSYFLMRALMELPGIVVYPSNGIGIILLSAVTSIILWKERLKRSNYLFIALASIALLLIYPR